MTVNTETKQQTLDFIWANTHSDFKLDKDGQRMILVCRGGGSHLVELEHLTDSEIKLSLRVKKSKLKQANLLHLIDLF